MKVILRYRYLFNLPFSAIKIDEPPRHSQGAGSPWSEQLKVRLNPPLKAPSLPTPPPAGKDMTPRNLSESPPDIRFMKHLRACNDDLMHPIPCAVVIPLLHIAAPNLIFFPLCGCSPNLVFENACGFDVACLLLSISATFGRGCDLWMMMR